ncbi:MAG: 23S rRNA (adenine(2503)-C(2))-methyltransferase RlmN [Treponema sp.]|jgi:23S rRNA (adenine2503-C2)-methyltransferase|nr:23S rRNA (adenine(2503)-C(2))-methyltransferase RlmN [Treponema sp.]
MGVRQGLAGYPLEALQDMLNFLPSYRAKQIFTWINRGSRSFEAMTDLPRPLRAELGQRFSLLTAAVRARLTDPDGTEKLQICLQDGALIESVLLRGKEGRRTACLSTQAGCPMGCVFCKTGALGLRRNLDASEIVEQWLLLRFPPESGPRDIANLVIMGMGEPLLNLGELRKALGVFMDPQGAGISKRRITLSTSGIVRGIRDLGENGPDIRLALSLTTADEALREKLMPVSRANPLPALKEALREYQRRTNQRVTLEMTLLKGVNMRERDIAALEKFLRGLDAAVNLIPWNAVEGLCFEGRPLQEPEPQETARFMTALEQRGIRATQRFRKGRSIHGACGQLG